MIPRYTRQEMGRIWSDPCRFQLWMDIELAAVEAMAAEGLVPAAAAAELRAAGWEIGTEDIQAIELLESETHHDVIAFLTLLERRMGPQARFLHLGMTSSDVLDTALGLQLSRAIDLLLGDLDSLREAVRDQALRHKHSVMIGRTHGIHAEPQTFGLVCALWWAELGRQRERLLSARRSVAVGKLSGAVGTFAHLPPAVERRVCEQLGLEPVPISNQVVQRDRHAELFCCLACLGGTVEKIAVTIRHLQRTEVGEAAEPFRARQKGSSAMPHKRNPIGCENLTGVSRLLRSYALAALENVALWHERDISHSSVERVIAPDAFILADYALDRLAGILRGLDVDTDRMRENLDLTRGLVFSQTVLLALVRAGVARQTAYAWVQRNAQSSRDAGRAFLDLLSEDPDVCGALGREDLEALFDLQPVLRRTDEIFERVFGPAGCAL
ncbi:MAG: adenylosuccinate lyase [Deltaproteobacteria bacterium]|nr:adenylosuccinate lyase [Deltaproteobacteria bacterium]